MKLATYCRIWISKGIFYATAATLCFAPQLVNYSWVTPLKIILDSIVFFFGHGEQYCSLDLVVLHGYDLALIVEITVACEVHLKYKGVNHEKRTMRWSLAVVCEVKKRNLRWSTLDTDIVDIDCLGHRNVPTLKTYIRRRRWRTRPTTAVEFKLLLIAFTCSHWCINLCFCRKSDAQCA